VESGEKDWVVLDAVLNRAAIADVAAQVKVAPGDVMEVTALIDTINKYKVEGIIHLAYQLGTGGIRNPLPSINVNCIGTTNISRPSEPH
jgi:UDP-glucose 4-epimerase